MSSLLPVLVNPSEQRTGRDRAELLTALLHAPGVDDFYRADIIAFPQLHPVYGWGCGVPGCMATKGESASYCRAHAAGWGARRPGMTRVEFGAAATPITKKVALSPGVCRICPGRPAQHGNRKHLCKRHWTTWSRLVANEPDTDLEAWAGAQEAFRPLGKCEVTACHELAETPLGLCPNHLSYYRAAGRPGNARLPVGWFRDLEPQGLPVPRLVDDENAYREWLHQQRWMRRRGMLNLTGCPPLVKLEFQWGLWSHASMRHPSRWSYAGMQSFLERCRLTQVSSVVELLEVGRMPAGTAPMHSHQRMILRELTDGLRRVYFSPSDTRDAGFIETEHFGRKMHQTRGYFDLTAIPQRWLRDLVWDDMAERLQSADCPRRRGPFDGLRRGALELAAFLELDAPRSGHDPTLLFAEHAQRFAADQRLRASKGLPSLGVIGKDGRPGVVTEVTRRVVFNNLRAMALRALEAGRNETIGLSTSFVTALPVGGSDTKRSRSPFTDEMARALADADNLTRLTTEHDSHDRGARDVWEAIVLTGRRSQEILSLRLDCIGRHNGFPLLWHDQTKVGRYDQAIRIPERLYERLDARRTTTLGRFYERYGREPSTERAQMALFPSHIRNPDFDKQISYTYFYSAFRKWVDSLDLGHAVAHQAGTPWRPGCWTPAPPSPTSASTWDRSATGWPSTTPTSATKVSRAC